MNRPEWEERSTPRRHRRRSDAGEVSVVAVRPLQICPVANIFRPLVSFESVANGGVCILRSLDRRQLLPREEEEYVFERTALPFATTSLQTLSVGPDILLRRAFSRPALRNRSAAVATLLSSAYDAEPWTLRTRFRTPVERWEHAPELLGERAFPRCTGRWRLPRGIPRPRCALFWFRWIRSRPGRSAPFVFRHPPRRGKQRRAPSLRRLESGEGGAR